MRYRGELFIGSILLIFGLITLISNIFHIDFGTICWPTGLILVGLWLILRPRFLPDSMGYRLAPFGNARHAANWQVAPEETWMFVGNVRYDLSEANLPPGETTLRVFAFVGDVKVKLPAEIGLAVTATAFLNDTKILGQKREAFLTPIEYTTPNYAAAERKIRLETYFFILDLDVYPI